jgi:anti-sigma B factor antagonist
MPGAHVLFDSISGRADALPPVFACSRTNRGRDAVWVHVVGELDLATAPELERALREARSRARLVVLDLRELAFMDSAGAHVIIEASVCARQRGGRLVLLRTPPDVGRLFTLTGSSGEVEIGDIAPVEPPVRARQRSLVALSLLRTG